MTSPVTWSQYFWPAVSPMFSPLTVSKFVFGPENEYAVLSANAPEPIRVPTVLALSVRMLS